MNLSYLKISPSSFTLASLAVGFNELERKWNIFSLRLHNRDLSCATLLPVLISKSQIFQATLRLHNFASLKEVNWANWTWLGLLLYVNETTKYMVQLEHHRANDLGK